MATLPFTENVIPQLLEWRRAGLGSALVTLVGVDGSSPRRVGSQMAVNARGDYAGYISSGCAEAAIVAEAVAAIASGAPRTVRLGAGSRYMDVVLPCGSGIDVHFDAAIPTSVLEGLQATIGARVPAKLEIGFTPDSGAGGIQRQAAPQVFVRQYQPVLRIVVAGRGVIVETLAMMARPLEWEIVVASPDAEVLQRIAPLVRASQHLTRPGEFDASVIDAFSAVVLLFHDHDWEPPILAKCAGSPAFYVGALGSRRTHGERRLLLEGLGCAGDFVERIHSPVGLNIGAKNPPEIALAILAEILSAAPAPDARLAHAQAGEAHELVVCGNSRQASP
jgi:xanthine dehydrogenase accessory factor